MNRPGKDWFVLCSLVAIGLASRLVKEWGQFSIPNFHAVSAVALFAGYYFRSRTMAALVPLVTMVVSDALIGGHHPLVMASVYGCLLAPIAVARWAKLDSHQPGRIAVTSLAMSILFFVVTNFATWCTPMYSHTLRGLTRCYAVAIPFFGYTMLGDLLFSLAIFGVYAVATRRSEQAELQPATR